MSIITAICLLVYIIALLGLVSQKGSSVNINPRPTYPKPAPRSPTRK